ncbi:MAG: phosphopantetheine-binding protein, partial [Candidatus Binataceae bacterium]
MRSYLGEQLPAYMIPARYVVLPELPLTPTGKLDRRRLPNPEESSRKRTYTERPASKVERMLRDLWQAMLPNISIGREENIFELGAHSLLVVKAKHRMFEQSGINIPLVAFFKYPTISSLAENLIGGEVIERERLTARAEAMQETRLVLTERVNMLKERLGRK